VCITSNHSDTKSNSNPNPAHNSKHPTKYSSTYPEKIHTRQCHCTVLCYLPLSLYPVPAFRLPVSNKSVYSLRWCVCETNSPAPEWLHRLRPNADWDHPVHSATLSLSSRPTTADVRNMNRYSGYTSTNPFWGNYAEQNKSDGVAQCSVKHAENLNLCNSSYCWPRRQVLVAISTCVMLRMFLFSQ